MNKSMKLLMTVLFTFFLPAVKNENSMLCKRWMTLRGFKKILVQVKWKGN